MLQSLRITGGYRAQKVGWSCSCGPLTDWLADGLTDWWTDGLTIAASA